MMNPKAVGILAACCAMVVGCGGENEFAAPPPPTVTTQSPTVKNVTIYAEFTGRTAAVETVEVRARVRGFLNSMEFEAGQLVKKGDLLFTIEPEPFEAAVAAAEAQLAGRAADLELAEVTLQRAQAAYEKEAVSDIEMAEVRAKRDVAQAAVEMAEAALINVRIDLGYTKIHAPIDGRISRDLVSVGNLVGSGDSTLLTTIVRDDPMHVYVTISERDLLTYLEKRPRNTPREERVPLELRTADGEIYPETGFADFADNVVDPTTGTLRIRAVFPNPDERLYPGMFGRVRVPVVTDERMLVPEIALQRDLVGPYLLVVGEGNKVERRDVELGEMIDAKMRVIESGIQSNESVIVSGLQRARPGIVVNPEASATSGAEGEGGGEDTTPADE